MGGLKAPLAIKMKVTVSGAASEGSEVFNMGKATIRAATKPNDQIFLAYFNIN